ncbi:YhbD family protein [Paenibacillus cremeus]|uniref:DUF4004 family protein n=1 Tax=Paenibacillus cremeus TaxID=2163881 RepID=A0A559KA34_9BACL|nr:YhbD family protein [Paenibacillus cremeus]TVY08991.1 DUF4004 family protein [Paenibacillus cremeus]
MEQELISKKELLELTDISYGQLYRWKRKNLIPEDWFIRKSTFTGQETFFEKKKVLERINKIKNMKDDLSLDELADVFETVQDAPGGSPANPKIALYKEQLIERNIVTTTALNVYIQQHGEMPVYSFPSILSIYVLDQLLAAGEMNLDEGKLLLQTLEAHLKSFEGKHCELIFTRKMGISSFILVSSPNEIYFDRGVKVVARYMLTRFIEELTAKINGTEGR